LAPREVEERRAEALLRNDAQIDLEPVRDDDARLRVALPDDARDLRQRAERGDDRLRPAGDGEQVDVADRFATAAERARDLDPCRAGQATDALGERDHQRLDGREQHAPAARLHEREALQDLFLAAYAEVR